MAKSFDDYRGIRDVRVAFNVVDNANGYSAGEWEDLEGCESLAVAGSESYGERYRDNQAVGGILSEGTDVATVVMDVLARNIRAKLEGRTYIEGKDMIVKTKKTRNFVALSYIGKLTDGTEEVNIMYKCLVTGGDTTHNTENDGTDVATVQYVFNGAFTAYKCECGNNKKETFKSVCIPITEAVTEEMLLGEFTDGKSTLTPLTPEQIIALGN